MQPFHKGQKLIMLCEQRTRATQQVLARHVREKQRILDEIETCKKELQAIHELLVTQRLNNVATTRAKIYVQRRQQALLLHRRQSLRLEQNMRVEKISEIDEDIKNCRHQLVLLKQRETKFIDWTSMTKKEWLLKKEIINEQEIEEYAPWKLQHS